MSRIEIDDKISNSNKKQTNKQQNTNNDNKRMKKQTEVIFILLFKAEDSESGWFAVYVCKLQHNGIYAELVGAEGGRRAYACSATYNMRKFDTARHNIKYLHILLGEKKAQRKAK